MAALKQCAHQSMLQCGGMQLAVGEQAGTATFDPGKSLGCACSVVFGYTAWNDIDDNLTSTAAAASRVNCLSNHEAEAAAGVGRWCAGGAWRK